MNTQCMFRRALQVGLFGFLLFGCNHELSSPPAVEQPLIFAVIGDYGYDIGGSAEGDVAALVKSWNPAFILTTGDNNYEVGASATIDENIGKYYHEFIHPYQGQYGEGASTNRFFPTLGNHDWAAPNATPYLEYFALPGNERYYDFIWGTVHFFALDSDPSEPDGNDSASVQGMWLQQRLSASTSFWNIVYFHHPPYSSGYCCNPITLLESSWMRWPFKEWGTSAVLCGHAHSYERMMIDSLAYFVNGLGGSDTTPFLEDPAEGTIIRFNYDFGAMRITATSESMKLEFITRTGAVIDPFTLTRIH